MKQFLRDMYVVDVATALSKFRHVVEFYKKMTRYKNETNLNREFIKTNRNNM